MHFRSHIGGGRCVSITFGILCVDFRTFFCPAGTDEIKRTRCVVALRLRIVRGGSKRGGKKYPPTYSKQSSRTYATTLIRDCVGGVAQCLGCSSLACGLTRIFYSRAADEPWSRLEMSTNWLKKNQKTSLQQKLLATYLCVRSTANGDSSLEQVCIMSSKQSLNFKYRKYIRN